MTRRRIAVIGLLIACGADSVSLTYAQGAKDRLVDLVDRPMRLASHGESMADSFQFEIIHTERDEDGLPRTKRLLVESRDGECELAFLTGQRSPRAHLRHRIFTLVNPANPSQYRFLGEGRFLFGSSIDAAGIPGFELHLSASRKDQSGVAIDLRVIMQQLLARAVEVTQRSQRNYQVKWANGLQASIVLADENQDSIFPIERLTIQQTERHSVSVDHIYVNRWPPLSLLSSNQHLEALPALRGSYGELPADSKVEELDWLWDEMRDGNPELDAAGKELMRRFSPSIKHGEKHEHDGPVGVRNRTQRPSRLLTELLDQPWRLTSSDDSASNVFQFECVHTIANEGGAPWVRRMLVQRKGNRCGALLLTKQYVPWALLTNGQFLLIDPDNAGRFGVVKGVHFQFVGGLGAQGTLGFGIGSSSDPDRTTTIDLNLPGMVRTLLSKNFEITQNDDEAFVLHSTDGASCTIVRSGADGFPIDRVTLDTGRSRFDFEHFHVDNVPPLDFLTVSPELSSLPPLSDSSIEILPDPNFSIEGKIWTRLRDGNDQCDSAGQLLLKCFRRTAEWPPAID